MKKNTPVWFRHKYSVWDQTTLYVDDADEPVVVGLPKCERLHLVTMHVDNAHNKTTKQGKPKVRPAQIRNITDMKSMYPQQFDKFRNFAGTAKLHHTLMPHESAACTPKTS